jgi:hypothetical protein
MYGSRWVARIAMTLGPIAASASIGACAADTGDPTKETQLSGTDGPVISGEAGTPPGPDSSSSPPPGMDATATADAPSLGDSPTSFPDSTSPFEASPLPEGAPPVDGSPPVDAPASLDTGPVDTGPPPTGCAAGATIIAMTKTGASGNFNVMGAVCVTYMGTVTGWNASNVQGRTVTVVGSTTQMPTITGDSIGNQPGLSPGADGYIYWNFSAGSVDYSSISTY